MNEICEMCGMYKQMPDGRCACLDYGRPLPYVLKRHGLKQGNGPGQKTPLEPDENIDILHS